MTASKGPAAELASSIAAQIGSTAGARRAGESICVEIIGEGPDTARLAISAEGLAWILEADEDFDATVTLRASAGTAARIHQGSLEIPDAIAHGLIKVTGAVSRLAEIGEQLRKEED